VRYLKLVSLLMTITGVLAVGIGLALGLDKTIVLAGMMLIIAGTVKIGMVAIWHGFAGFGVPLTSAELTNDSPVQPTSRDEGRL
jgi:hypothetical protein